MSKVSKELHQCKKCGRLSSAKSVLTESKDKKSGLVSYRCTNSKKCAQDKKIGLTNGQRKIVRVKKAAPVKKGAKKK